MCIRDRFYDYLLFFTLYTHTHRNLNIIKMSRSEKEKKIRCFYLNFHLNENSKCFDKFVTVNVTTSTHQRCKEISTIESFLLDDFFFFASCLPTYSRNSVLKNRRKENFSLCLVILVRIRWAIECENGSLPLEERNRRSKRKVGSSPKSCVFCQPWIMASCHSPTIRTHKFSHFEIPFSFLSRIMYPNDSN